MLFKKKLILLLAMLLFTTLAFAQNKSIELNNGVNDEMLQAGGWDSTVTSWSFETWIKFREVSTSDESHYLHLWMGGSSEGAQFYSLPSQLLTTAGNGYSFGLIGETEITLDTWHHIAITVDGDVDEFYLYLNGEEEISGPSNANQLEATPTMLDSLCIGHFRGLAYDGGWSATMAKYDEVRVWYKALTQAEVKANMNNALTSAEGLEAVYNFDGADINTDATGNGHDLFSAGRVDASNLSDDAPVLTDVEEQRGVTPTEFSLTQNYPNPFNPTTVIDFAIAKESNVTLNVYNVVGEKVAELVNNNFAAGTYSVSFDASNLSSGIYFYKISAGNFVAINKMMLLK